MCRRPLPAALLALVLGAGACAHGRGTPEDPLVAEVVFRGVKSVDQGELADALATHGPLPRPGITGTVLRERQRFEADALPSDVERIKAFYRQRGYYDVQVDEPSVAPAGKGLVNVVFRVSEGRAARVSKLEIVGLEPAPEAARRLDRLPLRVGDVFRLADYDASRAAIQSALQNNGWATSEVTQSAVVRPEDASVEVRYEAKPGIRYKFGPIFVGRVVGVSAKKIQDQVSAVIRTGEWWDESRLAEAKRRILALGVFGAVSVAHPAPDAERGIIPIVIDLTQAKYQTVRAGPGAAFDPTRWDVEAQVGWQHRNFLGDLRKLTLDVRGGYAWVPTPFTPRKQGFVGSATAQFEQPGAFGRYVDLTARAQVERGIEEAYDYVAQRLRLGLPLKFLNQLALVPSINVELYELSNTASDFVPGQPPPPGSTQPVLENCQGNLCLLGYLEQLIAWDARDNPINTRRGWLASLSLQEGLPVGGYGYSYLRFQPELRAFYPLGRKTVAAFRARIGALVPINETGDPPIVARFYAGGPNSMRGYYTSRLSPMIQQEGKWVPVGANGVADGSVELRIDLAGSLGLVVFVDTANVSNYSAVPSTYKTALDPTLLQWAAGLGLRYRTPFGPLRFDVGVRLPNDLAAGVPFNERFPTVPYTLAPDGTYVDHREPIVAIQVALGEAF